MTILQHKEINGYTLCPKKGATILMLTTLCEIFAVHCPLKGKRTIANAWSLINQPTSIKIQDILSNQEAIGRYYISFQDQTLNAGQSLRGSARE